MNEQQMAALARQIDLDGRVEILEEAQDADGEWFLLVAPFGAEEDDERWEIRSPADGALLKEQL